jgi:endonuclease/exonuclease/phosphatase family metal-dependent hydrolase
MHLITLNTWGGRAGKPELLDFFRRNAKTDIFCLQEILSDSYNYKEFDTGLDESNIMTQGMQDISTVLSGHLPYFFPHHTEHYGLLTLVSRNLAVEAQGDVFVYKTREYIPEGDVWNHARNIAHTTIRMGDTPVTVVNFHGLWNGKGKTDTPDRIAQSQNILRFLEGVDGEIILCGDFNLLPDTESLRMFEDFWLRNLVQEYGVTSTRTSFYEKPEKFADYVFVSKGIAVRDFQVLPDEVSDHAPLFLDFDLA